MHLNYATSTSFVPSGTQTYDDILLLVATVLTLISLLEVLMPELFPVDMLQVIHIHKHVADAHTLYMYHETY